MISYLKLLDFVASLWVTRQYSCCNYFVIGVRIFSERIYSNILLVEIWCVLYTLLKFYCVYFCWLSTLDESCWLHNMAALMQTAATAATTIENEGRSVLVHCSDGWDCTPQIVSIAEIMLDPYYRTIEVRCTLFNLYKRLILNAVSKIHFQLRFVVLAVCSIFWGLKWCCVNLLTFVCEINKVVSIKTDIV